MQILEREATRAGTKRVLPVATCVITSTPDHWSDTYGHLARVVGLAEDKYVVGRSRRHAVAEAIDYATEVLKVRASSIRFGDGFGG